MNYAYKCPHCEIEIIIDKSMNDSNRVEHCTICESELRRVWIAPTITTGDGFKK